MLRALPWCCLLAGCSIDDRLPEPLVLSAADAGADVQNDQQLEGGSDPRGCTTDRDGDRACSTEDCDDGDEHRSPLLVEYCPDNVDNDCDEQIDFADDCGASNDSCDDAIAILTQDEVRDQTFWPFLLPLGRYDDDYGIGEDGSTGTCAPADRTGGDAVFELRTVAASEVSLTATGRDGARPALVARMGCASADCDRDERAAACATGAGVDLCDEAGAENLAEAAITVAVAESRRVFLIVDDLADEDQGVIELRVQITKLR